MYESEDTHKFLFKKIAFDSFILFLIALLVSLIVTPDFFHTLTGLVLGYIVALFKIYYTFKSVIIAINTQKQAKKGKLAIAANVLGYVLIIAVLLLCVAFSAAMLFSAIIGIFIVYFSIIIYCIFLKDK